MHLWLVIASLPMRGTHPTPTVRENIECQLTIEITMHCFGTALELVDKAIYLPHKLAITNLQQESQNAEYAASRFTLSSALASKTVRFRVAKITPTKVGQFVTFWRKDLDGINQAYEYDEAPDLLVITVFKASEVEGAFAHNFGQFVFPKDILINKGIVKSSSGPGKMAMRVYPSWDIPTSKTAMKTQQWQLNYFFSISAEKTSAREEVQKLYF